ncbi:MAG: hypothetical protein WBM17_06215 [Anaerolineales bacterium]
MKNKLLFPILALLIAFASIGAIGVWGIGQETSPAKNRVNDISVNLISAAYSDDHVAVEYSVDGSILTSYGDLTACPVGGTSIVTASAQEIQSGDSDFKDCRPDGKHRFLVTQFIYSDFQSEGNKPTQVKIKIGDIDFVTEDNRLVHVPQIGVYPLDFPVQADPNISSFPTSVAEVASGLKMRIKRADFSATLGKVDACITLPDTRTWVFSAVLNVGSQKIPMDYWTIPNYKEPGVLASRERCFAVVFSRLPDHAELQPGQMSFSIDKISLDTPDCVQGADYNKIKDELQQYGVKVRTDPAGDYCFAAGIRDVKDPNIVAKLWTDITNMLREEVAGPLEIIIK